MATLAFLERTRIAVLSEDFDRAINEVERFRDVILQEKQTDFKLRCQISYMDNDKLFNVDVRVNPEMTFGQLKFNLQQQFKSLANYRLTVIAGKTVPLDIYTLKMLGITSHAFLIHILATNNDSGSKLNINKQYRVDIESYSELNEGYLNALDRIEGLLRQKKVLEVVKAIDSLKDHYRFAESVDGDHPPVIKRLVVSIEDIEKTHGAVIIPRVNWNTKVSRLKKEFEERFSIPQQLQMWFMVNEVRNDDDMLSDIFSHSDKKCASGRLDVQLYLVTPESAGISAEGLQKMHNELINKVETDSPGIRSMTSLSDDEEDQGQNLGQITNTQNETQTNMNAGFSGAVQMDTGARPKTTKKPTAVVSSSAPTDQNRTATWTCNVCTVVTNSPSSMKCEVCGEGVRPKDFVPPQNSISGAVGGAQSMNTSANREPVVAWACGVCSFASNRPMYQLCEMCGQGIRPANFVIPEWYQPDESELAKMNQEHMNNLLTQKLLEEEAEREKKARVESFKALQEAEHSNGCFPNLEPFECPICFENIEVGQGAILRQCHHTLCNTCIIETLSASENGVDVQCPFVDERNNQCEQPISQQEMRALLSLEQLDKLLQANVSQAEAAEPNSFHCKSANCKGWCIVADEVNFFPCPICKQVNCLTCAAQHQPMNCKQYQEDLKQKAANDEAARATEEMFKQLIAQGEAMHCPQCKIMVQKKSGCDWMQCSMCKTEICWATRGPRWGPGGKGDTSGGCKCRSPNICHPKCGNCH